jgi:hypothetical protein
MNQKAFPKTAAGADALTAAGGLATAVTVAGAIATHRLERRIMDKVTWRLVPFLIVCYFIAFLDRVNVGFANATMSKDLALSAAAFGGAAGIFFIGYFFFEFEVPRRASGGGGSAWPG